MTDIAAAQDGDLDPVLGLPMYTVRGVEVGNIFKLGTRYTAAMGARFLTREGREEPVIMGSYGIGVGRLLACVAEEHNDDYGLTCRLPSRRTRCTWSACAAVKRRRSRLYSELTAAGLQVLFDDRDESPGVKFNDADLIGVPVRLTVGKRSLEAGGVELKLRREKERTLVALEALLTTVQATVQAEYDAIAATVVEVPFET